jgi:hypothetical protein
MLMFWLGSGAIPAHARIGNLLHSHERG